MDTPYVQDDFVSVTKKDGTVEVGKVTYLVENGYTSAVFDEPVVVENGETFSFSIPYRPY